MTEAACEFPVPALQRSTSLLVEFENVAKEPSSRFSHVDIHLVRHTRWSKVRATFTSPWIRRNSQSVSCYCSNSNRPKIDYAARYATLRSIPRINISPMLGVALQRSIPYGFQTNRSRRLGRIWSVRIFTASFKTCLICTASQETSSGGFRRISLFAKSVSSQN